MNLVEAEAVGPVEGDAPLITPPRPPHRRVSVSLLFTLTVLTGTVVAIYLTFPARHNVLLTEAIAQHRDATSAWDLTAPTTPELRAWMFGVVGKDAPMPPAGTIEGARRIEVFERGAAVVRVQVGDDHVTYLVQRAHGVAPKRGERTDGDLHAIAWRTGPFTCVAVGPEATFASWRESLR
ncbi:MAG TPA: hypothetical protein VM513_21225 [Kofleriaceae bacterium]|jgi:hypothetical protein|nr:hypothetical protein [Kofleriaceae bacterium]